MAGFIQQASDLAKLAKQGGKFVTTGSLSAIAKVARVEPLGVISRDCMALDYIPDIMSMTLNIFTGYYLQAISLTTMTVNKVKVAKILEALNPDRDFNTTLTSLESINFPANSLARESLASMPTNVTTAYSYRLPMSKNARASQDNNRLCVLGNVSLEDDTFAQDVYNKIKEKIGQEPNWDDDSENPFHKQNSSSVGDKSSKLVNEPAQLGVGKIIDVELKVGDKTVSIPVTIRITSAPLPNASVVGLLSGLNRETSFKERVHEWRAGRIRFMQDLIFAQDLISAHKRRLMTDKDGVLTQTIDRARRNIQYGMATGNPSMATASNIYIVSEQVIAEVERKLGGSFTNPRIRAKAFDETYAMIIVVIDRNFERVSIYVRDVAVGTNISVKEIKHSNKSKGPDIMDVFKTIQTGNTLSF